MNPDKLDEFTSAYVETLLWSTTDGADGEFSLDEIAGVGDLSDEALSRIIQDCNSFQYYAEDVLGDELVRKAEQAGHDFCLTRNRHGAGFWDGDWDYISSTAGVALTELAHTYGQMDAYMAEGKIWVC